MAGTEFVADVMLGRLARGLRMLGADVLYWNAVDDSELVRVAERDGRVLLTRDVELCRRRMSVRALLIESSDHREQLRQVVAASALEASAAFSRCLKCNTVLEQMSREAARWCVPPFVLQTHERFTACPSCARVYWDGTHVEQMKKRRFLGR